VTVAVAAEARLEAANLPFFVGRLNCAAHATNDRNEAFFARAKEPKIASLLSQIVPFTTLSS